MAQRPSTPATCSSLSIGAALLYAIAGATIALIVFRRVKDRPPRFRGTIDAWDPAGFA